MSGQLIFELGYRPATDAVHLRLTGEGLVCEHAGVLAGFGGVVGERDPAAEFLIGLVAYLPLPLDQRSAVKLEVTFGGFMRIEAAPPRDGFFVGGRLLFRHLFGDV
ncbi:MAG: hypothetical protein IPL40_13515 [Proteobacteria bacterium]|nr:hypothetical protein [Pseudomonadota bacterium]